MQRRFLVIALALGTVAAVAVPAAGADRGSNAPSGTSAEASCSFGSCFAPLYNAEGEAAVYKGPAAGRVEFADCCVAGDKYKVVAKGATGNRAVTIFTSRGSLSGCSTGPYADSSAVELSGGATQVKMVALKLPGGIPAAALVRMSSANWQQTSGSAACF